MMTVSTIRNRKYEILATQTCAITTTDGDLLGVTFPGKPMCITAVSDSIELSDDSATVTEVGMPVRRLRLQLPVKQSLPSYGKYSHCLNVNDLISVQYDYVTDVSAGVWVYSLSALQNGDAAFASVNKLRDFLVGLPCLQSGRGMFAGCTLSLCSIKILAHSVPHVSGAVLTIGVDVRLKNSAEMIVALNLMESKGWLLEVQYNTPDEVAALAELEYLESPATPDNLVLAYFSLPLPDVTSPNDSIMYETEHMFMPKGTIVQGEGVPLNYGAFLIGNHGSWGKFVAVDGVLNNPTSPGTANSDWNISFSCSDFEWHRIKYELGSRQNAKLRLSIDDVLVEEKELLWASGLPARTCFYLFGAPATSFVARALCGKKRAAKIWVNGALLYDLVPVLDETGTACMYDKQSRRYFYNEGKGTFSWSLKSVAMQARMRSIPLSLPRSPIWARVQDGKTIWCHYITDSSGWQRFASLEDAMESLGQINNNPM